MDSKVATGFNRLAPIYTILTQIVFGKTLQQAQVHVLHSIKPGNHVLILGGGSGDLLKSLLKQQSQITVDYIDISSKMIQLARKKTESLSNVNFIVGTEQNIPNRTYAVVITNFYLDLFSDSTLPHVIQKIKRHLTPGARWLVADFVEEKSWHRIMLWCMYLFFRTIARIEASQVPDWQSTLEKAGMHAINSKKFYCGFIKSSVYESVISPG